MNKFIVAEVSKTWSRGDSKIGRANLLSERFELIIEVNRQRGYRLHSFALNQLIADTDSMVETIIAVFEQALEPLPTLPENKTPPGARIEKDRA